MGVKLYILFNIGLTILVKIIVAETGFPGRPKISFLSQIPRIVGFPGFTDIPWTSIPGLPKFFITFAVVSL